VKEHLGITAVAGPGGEVGAGGDEETTTSEE